MRTAEPTVELIYDKDCPNVPLARENILRAFRQTNSAPKWKEWNRADPVAPAYARTSGSPTVLVNGRDVAGNSANDANCCRLYAGGIGAPPAAMIALALLTKTDAFPIRQSAVTLLPAIGSALLPKLVCPACWPAYTALLSAFGVGFINYSTYLLPLTVVFLVAALALLFYSARRGYAPALLGTLAAAMILIGKFYFDSSPATYLGVALLVAASLWNAWPRRSVLGSTRTM
jgi:hypothetical protein